MIPNGPYTTEQYDDWLDRIAARGRGRSKVQMYTEIIVNLKIKCTTGEIEKKKFCVTTKIHINSIISSKVCLPDYVEVFVI